VALALQRLSPWISVHQEAGTEAAFPFTAYDVAVDRDSLAAWNLGEDGRGYAVALTGPVDGRWARFFYLVRPDSPGYARFHLDKSKKIVWFACREGDPPAKIQPVLDVLSRLVDSVNQAAEREAWDEWGETRT
jgi:hypothetical protein